MTDYDDFFAGVMVGFLALMVVIMLIVAVVDGDTCHESVSRWQGRCEPGAVASLEPPDVVICRCPVKP